MSADVQKYRLGEYEGAQELYDELLASCDSVGLRTPLVTEADSIQSSSEHPDILENLSATSAHLDFISNGYKSHLSAPPATVDHPRHVPAEGELETYVPSLPTGWAVGGQTATPAPKTAVSVKKDAAEQAKKGPRHKLPKGAVVGKPSNEDVSLLAGLLHRTADM